MMNARSIAADAEEGSHQVVLDKRARENLLTELTVPNDRRLVLLISDDPLMARALSRLLRKAGYEVVACDGGGSGAGIDGQQPPALVIVDVPDDRSPKRLTVGYRPSSRSDAPSILWIGDSIETERRRDGHLAKPFTTNQLLAKVASLLGN